MAIDKTEVSKLISVARAIPDKIIAVVGPAPKVGRPRWLKLADAIANPAARKAALGIAGDLAMLLGSSDAKFAQVFKAATSNLAISAKSIWKSADGRAFATISKSEHSVSIVVANDDPGFAEFVVECLEVLHEEFCSRRSDAVL